MSLKRRCRSASSPGSSTKDANSTARQAARGRRAHQRCKVEGCPWRIDFSCAAALLIASKGNATSISFFFIFWRLLKLNSIELQDRAPGLSLGAGKKVPDAECRSYLGE